MNDIIVIVIIIIIVCDRSKQYRNNCSLQQTYNEKHLTGLNSFDDLFDYRLNTDVLACLLLLLAVAAKASSVKRSLRLVLGWVTTSEGRLHAVNPGPFVGVDSNL